MRNRIITLALLLGLSVTALAGTPKQEIEWTKGFSLELSTGLAPYHMTATPFSNDEVRYARNGQGIDMTGALYPNIILSGLWRVGPRSEIVLMSSVSWSHFKLIQYGPFGTDPNGQPRYRIKGGEPAGWGTSSLIPSISVLYRHLWNPMGKVVLYSEAGLGFTAPTFLLPLPTITPIGARYGWEHFYLFAELTMGTSASIVQGGLGWHF